jgi:hypothetical protein
MLLPSGKQRWKRLPWLPRTPKPLGRITWSGVRGKRRLPGIWTPFGPHLDPSGEGGSP